MDVLAKEGKRHQCTKKLARANISHFFQASFVDAGSFKQVINCMINVKNNSFLFCFNIFIESKNCRCNRP